MNSQQAVNSTASDAVQAPMVTRLPGSAMLLLLPMLGLGACVDISGGAAELSWSFQTFAGDPIPGDDCEGTNIAQVRLSWEPPPGGDQGDSGLTSFPCNSYRGITDFVIAEGAQLLRISPLCGGAAGALATAHTYEVPAPILRNLRPGQVTTLNSLLIVVDPAEPGRTDCACCATSAPPPDDVR